MGWCKSGTITQKVFILKCEALSHLVVAHWALGIVGSNFSLLCILWEPHMRTHKPFRMAISYRNYQKLPAGRPALARPVWNDQKPIRQSASELPILSYSIINKNHAFHLQPRLQLEHRCHHRSFRLWQDHELEALWGRPVWGYMGATAQLLKQHK